MTLDLNARNREGLKLKHRREMAGLSVVTAADLCGLTEAAILQGERDFYSLSDTDVCLLRKVYFLVRRKHAEDRRLEVEHAE